MIDGIVLNLLLKLSGHKGHDVIEGICKFCVNEFTVVIAAVKNHYD